LASADKVWKGKEPGCRFAHPGYACFANPPYALLGIEMTEWKFRDPPNVAVIASRKAVTGGEWIARVSHDAEDGGWQFHIADTGPLNDADAMVVSLRNIVQLDESVTELADLPLGWHAWRDSKVTPWQRAKLV
jgi:hypothetical protein